MRKNSIRGLRTFCVAARCLSFKAAAEELCVTPFYEVRMRTRSLYLLDDGGPRCMVGISGYTPNGARISGVYTPDEFRNRGYASNTVATLSRQTLAAGRKFCLLFGDSDAADTLHVYQRLGFKTFRDQLLIELVR